MHEHSTHYSAIQEDLRSEFNISFQVIPFTIFHPYVMNYANYCRGDNHYFSPPRLAPDMTNIHTFHVPHYCSTVRVIGPVPCNLNIYKIGYVKEGMGKGTPLGPTECTTLEIIFWTKFCADSESGMISGDFACKHL